MRHLNECELCHALDYDEEQLCLPRVSRGGCMTQTSLSRNLERMCAPTRSRLDFACADCGRPAQDASMVCESRLIRG